jgi:hypothetical protein
MESRFLAQQEQLQKFQAQADAQTFQNRVLMALIALLAAAAFFFYRSSRQASASPRWWGDAGASKSSGEAADAAGEEATQVPVRTETPVVDVDKPSAVKPAVEPVQASASVASPAAVSGNPVSHLHKLARGTDSLFAPLNSKTYDVQELFDVQEQAEFFTSVGQ